MGVRNRGGARTWRDFSAYIACDAETTVRRYRARLLRAKVIAICCVLGCLAAALWAIEVESLVLYLLFLAGIAVVMLAYMLACSALFYGLTEVMTRDCDVPRYRAAIEALRARDRFGRSRALCACELAQCDFAQLRFEDALERLRDLSIKRASNPLWFKRYQIEALCRHELGDEAGCAAALAALRAWVAGPGASRRNGRLDAPGALVDLERALSGPLTWGEDDIAAMSASRAGARYRTVYVALSMRLAEYEALRGDARRARAYVEEDFGPLLPVAERKRDELLALLDRKDPDCGADAASRGEIGDTEEI